VQESMQRQKHGVSETPQWRRRRTPAPEHRNAAPATGGASISDRVNAVEGHTPPFTPGPQIGQVPKRRPGMSAHENWIDEARSIGKAAQARRDA
jgi:hypothetical protein